MATTFDKDMNIITNFVKDMDIIAALDDQPNDVGGLTAAELKAKFDEGGKAIQEYINQTLIPEVLGLDSTEAARQQAETARITAEESRIAAEQARVTAEQSRATAESSRVTAEQARVQQEQARQQAEQARVSSTTGIVAQATEQADRAESLADLATAKADSAVAAATSAQNHADSASTSAAEALQRKADAQSAAESSENAAKTAQSWASGGTGSRADEDTNNAKYWAGQAHAAAGGGVITFNGRNGAVVPLASDYTPEMIGAAALGEDGKVPFEQLPVLNKACRLIVGTSTAGWTVNDCDYLCDGVDDQVELQAALDALPENGGEVIVLDGVYHLIAGITITKDNVTLSGNGPATELQHSYTSNLTLNKPLLRTTARNTNICHFTLNGLWEKSSQTPFLLRAEGINCKISHIVVKQTVAFFIADGDYFTAENCFMEHQNNLNTSSTFNGNYGSIHRVTIDQITVGGNYCSVRSCNLKELRIYGSQNFICGNRVECQSGLPTLSVNASYNIVCNNIIADAYDPNGIGFENNGSNNLIANNIIVSS